NVKTLESGGSITNSGTIEASAFASSDGSAFAYGINVKALESGGSISNSGLIDVVALVSASASASGTAYGIYVGDAAGNIENSGNISAKAAGGYAHGIFVEGTLTATIENNGTGSSDGIHVGYDFSSSSSSTRYAEGIFVETIGDGGSISNSGNIYVEADDSSSAFAYGINVLTIESGGSITNSGLIGVSASASTEVDAYGINVKTLDSGGSITNSGAIQAYAEGSSSVEAYAYGINVGTLGGSIANSGAIHAYADNSSSSSSSANAYGIYVEDAAGNIENSGIISADADNNAHGIYVDGTLTATIENNGTGSSDGIFVGNASSSPSYALGIFVDTIGDGGSITNSGQIVAIASASSSEAGAFGIAVRTVETGGAISNSGTIHVSAMASSSSYDAFAHGIYIESGDGDIKNSGKIITNALTEGYGIYVDGTLTAAIKNNGTDESDGIFVGTDTLPINAEGIFVSSLGESGSITNSGNIDVDARYKNNSSSLLTATAFGINIANDNSGSITNSLTGNIHVTASSIDTSGSGATAVGIYVEDNIDTITNGGNITVNAAATYKTAKAYGIQSDTVHFNGSISNSGYINVTVGQQSPVLSQRIAPSLDVYAAGIYVDTLEVGGTISNTGNIDITNNQTGGIVSGIFVNNMDGTISDVGTITTADEGTYAIYLKDGTGTLKLTADDDVTGLIHVNAHDVTIDATGQSAVFNFEDANAELGEFNTKTNEYSGAWITKGSDEYPSYSWSNISINSADMDTSSMAVPIFGNLLNELSATCTTPKLIIDDNIGYNTECSKKGISTIKPFIATSRDRSGFAGSNGANDTEISTNSVTVGFGGFTSTGVWLAAGAGQFVSKGESLPNSAGTSGYFVGYTLGKSFNNYYAETGLGYGISKTYNDRKIIGSEDANSIFNSNFTTAHLDLKRSFELSNSTDLQLFGSTRYSKQTNDKYTETNSSANATISERDIISLENKIGIEAVFKLNKGAIFTAGLSAVSRNMSGDETMNVTIETQEKNLATTLSDYSGKSLTIEYKIPVSVNGQFKFGAERKISESTSVNAGLRWSF
ncbi:autotransporter outer membrane beta-barrel domain-containing protein, partial [Amylibacter sp.]|nr:autotransporter outer membrane beta-barrel domain-containing protein [Amylibacter sp.]